MRLVSLVPSLTEAVAATRPEVLVGATDYCTHPPALDVPRVGGSKYPDLAKLLALQPDTVLMNVEENRERDADELRAAGVHVYVTYPRTVDAALHELTALAAFLDADPAWLAEAKAAWADPPRVGPLRAVIPVWRKPWIVLGADTFAGDVLARLGVVNVYAGDPERYPRPTLAGIHARRPDLAILPDEPYRFTGEDGPGTRYALVSGRHLTWYGPSLAQAPALLAGQLRVTSLPDG